MKGLPAGCPLPSSTRANCHRLSYRSERERKPCAVHGAREAASRNRRPFVSKRRFNFSAAPDSRVRNSTRKTGRGHLVPTTSRLPAPRSHPGNCSAAVPAASFLYHSRLSLSELGESAKAAPELRHLVAVEPDHTHGRVALGIALGRLGNPAAAEQEDRGGWGRCSRQAVGAEESWRNPAAAGSLVRGPGTIVGCPAICARGFPDMVTVGKIALLRRGHRHREVSLTTCPATGPGRPRRGARGTDAEPACRG